MFIVLLFYKGMVANASMSPETFRFPSWSRYITAVPEAFLISRALLRSVKN